MNEKSIDGSFKHDNRKFHESFARAHNYRARHRTNRRRFSYHTRRFIKWIENTKKLGDKIITGKIQ